MERKVGDQFRDGEVLVEVVAGTTGANEDIECGEICYYATEGCLGKEKLHGKCSDKDRVLMDAVYFRKVEPEFKCTKIVRYICDAGALTPCDGAVLDKDGRCVDRVSGLLVCCHNKEAQKKAVSEI